MGISVFVYDDNYDRRESLKLLIDMHENMVCTGSFNDCTNILNDIRTNKPDVILMDIDMPHMSGIDGVKLLRTTYADLYVIMQTVFDDSDKIFEAIEAGADGYILKTAPNIKIIEAIEDVSNGGAPMTASVAKKVISRFHKPPKTRRENFRLTNAETNILDLLVSGLSYKMISGKMDISYHTVNMHIKNIYKKLHVNSSSEAIKKANDNSILDVY